MSDTLSQDLLKELLSYEKSTGLFFWKIKKGSRAKGDQAGSKRKDGYIEIRINRKLYLAHRLAWLYVNGEFPECLDHIDHNTSNNKIENLRNVSHRENMRNRKLSCLNKSGVSGVSWCKKQGKWTTRLKVDGKYLFLGYFDNLEDASKAMQAAISKYKFHENHGKPLTTMKNE